MGDEFSPIFRLLRRAARHEGYVYQSGLIQAYLIAFLRIAFSKRNDVKSLVDSGVLKVIPVSLAKDGFTLKPSFQVDQHAILVVGGQELYNLDYVQENQNIPHEHFEEKFVTEVEIMGITTLNNKTSLIVGNNFVGSEGDGRSTLQCHVQRLRELQQFLNCLQGSEGLMVKEVCHTTECGDCLSGKAVCEACKSDGFMHWSPALRRCDRCLGKELPCQRAVCFNITTDCQSKLKTALELLQTDQREGLSDSYSTLTAPNPDIVHAGKNLHRSHSNWFLFIDNTRFSLVMLCTARLYLIFTEELNSAVPNIALRGRDRMDTSFIAECNAEPVQRIIQSMEFLVHMLVPEIFWKEYSLNKPGVLENPL